jgi:truncated hemoglobin YjbI
MQSVFEAIGGEEGLLRLAHAWHTRVMADEVVSHAFSHGFHPQHSERLAAYWGEALGERIRAGPRAPEREARGSRLRTHPVAHIGQRGPSRAGFEYECQPALFALCSASAVR